MTRIGEAGEVFDDTVAVRLLYDDTGYSSGLYLFLQFFVGSHPLFGLDRSERHSVEMSIRLENTDDVLG